MLLLLSLDTGIDDDVLLCPPTDEGCSILNGCAKLDAPALAAATAPAEIVGVATVDDMLWWGLPPFLTT